MGWIRLIGGWLGLILLVTACNWEDAPPPALTPPPTHTTIPTLPPPTALPTVTPLPTHTPLPSPTHTEVPVMEGSLTGGTENVTLRETPGTAGRALLILRGNTPLTLAGRTEDASWVQIELETGMVGWVPATRVQTSADVYALAVNGVAENAIPTAIPDAVVNNDAGDLRLRDAPGTASNVIDHLGADTQLAILGRTSENQWLQVQTSDGAVGWVAALHITVIIALENIPVTGVVLIPVASPTRPPAPAPAHILPEEWRTVITGVSDNVRQIFLRGQTMGNRANVFSKVGDSITVAWEMYTPIGRGTQQLAQYRVLQPVIDYFSTETARDGNSFANVSLAADNGWTTASVLNPELANYPVIWDPQCQPGEVPLTCEYRVVKPAIALIMLGTNDVAEMPVETYRANLEQIVQITVDRGTIPVLSTIPNRPGYDVAPYNQMIRSIAAAYDIPLWDYWQVMVNAPNSGISPDNIHPSLAPGGPDASVNFDVVNLGYGYTLRNLTALMVLDVVWREVIQR
jgi:uncharacterized protein YgiM (DUF1202 family)